MSGTLNVIALPPDPVAQFCGYYHDYHDISPARRVMQERVLREFEASVAPRSLLDVQADDLRDYLAALVRSGLHVNTVRQRLNAIRPFLTWLWQRKLIDADRLLELRDVGPPRGASGSGVPRPYKRPQVARFWKELDAAYPWAHDHDDRARAEEVWLKRWRTGTSKWARAQPYFKRVQIEAIVHLALYGALRRDEIFNLDLVELHPDNAYLVVRSRKNPHAEERVRAVPWISDNMRTAVGHWLTLRSELAPEHDRPWLSLHNAHRLKPLRHRQFEMLVRNIGSGWEYHRMRHTAATEMLRQGVPLEKVSKILGHSRLEQTRQYVEVLPDDVVKAVAGLQFDDALGREAA